MRRHTASAAICDHVGTSRETTSAHAGHAARLEARPFCPSTCQSHWWILSSRVFRGLGPGLQLKCDLVSSASAAVRRALGPTYGSVVYQRDFHHGLELAVLDAVFHVVVLDLLHEVMIQPAGLFGVHGAVKVWLCALFRSGQQGELRHCRSGDKSDQSRCTRNTKRFSQRGSDAGKQDIPHRTSPPMSVTLFFHW